MKNCFLILFRVSPLLMGLFAFTGSFAQEAGSPSFELYDMEPATINEKVIMTPGESFEPVRPNVSPSKKAIKVDSVAVRLPAKPSATPPKKQQSDEDDSILSFNFLYYLIERYKMQDIID